MCFINEFMSFCKIIGFTKQIYENKSLSPNHVFTFTISRFAIFIFLLIICWILIKIISLFWNICEINSVNSYLCQRVNGFKYFEYYSKYTYIYIYILLTEFISQIFQWVLWAHKGPILLKKLIILMKNHEIINGNIKIVNLGILKVKTWFGDKDY